MRRITLAAVALSAIAGTFPSSVMASPPTDGPAGRKCSYAATTDPSPEAGEDSMTGQINGGPLVGEAGGELICTLQVNSEFHSGPDTLVRSSGPADSSGVSVVAAADVAYVSPEDAQDYLCTSYRKADDSMLYWHPGNVLELDLGHWTTNPHKPCSAATQFSTGPLFEAADALVFCPALIEAHEAMDPTHAGPTGPIYIDHEGDVFIDEGDGVVRESQAEQEWWFDCPVYDDDGDAAHNARNPANPPVAPATMIIDP